MHPLSPLEYNFNPRLREGGDFNPYTKLMHFSKFQSTPPRGRRLGTAFENDTESAISIHASAREATDGAAAPPISNKISIHASAREATVHWNSNSATIGFQSTPPRGRRPQHRVVHLAANHFNPRLREGGDQPPALLPPQISPFQSTPPRGRRLH